MRRLAALFLLLGAVGRCAGQPAVPDPEPIVLPPFLVQERDGVDWIFGKGGGVVVLSACSEEQTRGFLRQYWAQRQEVEAIVPGEFLLRECLPTTIILYPKSRKEGLDHALRTELSEAGMKAAAKFTPLDDLRLSDTDSSFIFVVLDDTGAQTTIDPWSRSGRSKMLVKSPGYLFFLLNARAPALPMWYVTGATGLYESIRFQDGTAEGVELERDKWLSEETAESLREYHGSARPLVPLAELLSPLAPSGKTDAYQRVWSAEAELFVRWCLSGKVKGGDEKLRRLVAGAAVRPTSETSFREIFGIGYDDALDALSDYLPAGVSYPTVVESAPVHGRTGIDLAPATAGQIRRIRAEWSRRVLAAVRVDQAEEFPQYLKSVGSYIGGAYDDGERDPAFLATLALFKIQFARPSEGIGLLEMFPQAGKARPLAELELAQSHLSAPSAPGRAPAALTDAQAARVLGEVSASTKHGPLDPAYSVAMEAYIRRERPLGAADLTAVEDGARLYSRDSSLVLEAASLELRDGDPFKAKEMIDMGLWMANDPAAKARMQELRKLAQKALLAQAAAISKHQN